MRLKLLIDADMFAFIACSSATHEAEWESGISSYFADFEEVQACQEAGIPCTVVPGVTSAISVPGAVGVPVTQRGVVHSFTVISGHVPPGHPQSLNNWEALAQTGGTLVVIMGVKNSRSIANALLAGGRSVDTPAAVIQEGTTSEERTFRCTLSTLADVIEHESIKPPAVYVIGEVADL